MRESLQRNERGSFEIVVGLLISLAGIAIIMSMQMRADRRYQAQVLKNYSLSGFYANEIALVHAYVANVLPSTSPCPSPNVGCQKSYGRQSNLFWPARAHFASVGFWSLVWSKIGPAEAHASETPTRDVNNSGAANNESQVSGGASSGGEGSASGAFAKPAPSQTILRISPLDDEGRSYCSVFLLPDNKTERQLCFYEAAPAPIVDLKVNGSDAALTNLSAGSNATVTWTSSRADRCQLSVVELDASSRTTNTDLSSALSGSATHPLTAQRSTFTFSLKCQKGSRESVDSVRVTTAASPITLTLTVNRSADSVVIEKGARVSLEWSSTNADRCGLTIPPSLSSDVASGNTGNYSTTTLEANLRHQAVLQCTNSLGQTAEARIPIYVYQKIPMYRLYNPVADCHFYTTNSIEYNQRTSQGYLPEGIRFYVFDGSWRDNVSPIHRLYVNNGCHYYTTNDLERDGLVSGGTARFEQEEGYALTFGDPKVAGVAELSHLYNSQAGDHLFTAHPEERDGIVRTFPGTYAIHTQLGFGVVAPLETISQPRGIALYRLRNPNNQLHFWTPSCEEVRSAVRSGWSSEGIGFYLWERPIAGVAVPVYRLSHPNGNHMYTLNTNERDTLLGSGWTNEGVAGYGVNPASYSGRGALPAIYRFSHRLNGDHLFTPNRGEIIDPSNGRSRFAEWVDEGVAAQGPGSGDGVCEVTPPSQPVSVSLLANGSASPEVQRKGSNFVITWSSTNATSCSLRASSGEISTDLINGGGLILSNVLQNETLQLSCSGPGGTASKQVTLQVREPIPVYLLSSRCDNGGAPIESDTPQTFRSCTVNFRDDCAVMKDGAQWGYTSRGDSDKQQIDRLTSNLIQEARVGTCVPVSCAAQGGWDQGTYFCDGKPRIIRYR